MSSPPTPLSPQSPFSPESLDQSHDIDKRLSSSTKAKSDLSSHDMLSSVEKLDLSYLTPASKYENEILISPLRLCTTSNRLCFSVGEYGFGKMSEKRTRKKNSLSYQPRSLNIKGRPQRVSLSSNSGDDSCVIKLGFDSSSNEDEKENDEPIPERKHDNKESYNCRSCSKKDKRISKLISELKEAKRKVVLFEKQLLECQIKVQKSEHITKPISSIPTPTKRQLSNIVDLKGCLKLYCRVRPFTKSEESFSKFISLLKFDDNILEMYKPISTSTGSNNSGNTIDCSKYVFHFDKVFQPTADQELVFSEIQSTVESVVTEGYRTTIFAYGQTGSGKTYTIQGPSLSAGQRSLDQKNSGILHRSVKVLFERIVDHNEKNEQKLTMQLSCIEIYNEDIRDLLLNGNETYQTVQDLDHLYLLLDTSIRNRTVAATQYNDKSSRSHCIFRFRIYRGEHNTQNIGEDDVNVIGALNLIDLAGSERLTASDISENKDVNDSSQRQKKQRNSETVHINTSLYVLSQVLKAMADGSTFINYRNSTLTKLLREDFTYHRKQEVRSRIIMFINIRPPTSVQDKHIDKTISSLHFAKNAHTFDFVKQKIDA